MKYILDILAHRSLTIFLLVVLTLACGLASFFELKTALKWFYHSWWFMGLLGAFTAQTGLCVVRELMKRKVSVGFLMLHLGVVVLMVGGFWGYKKGIKGYLSLPVGGSASKFNAEWAGTDFLVPAEGHPIEGEFLGIETGKAFLNPREGKTVSFPVADLRAVRIDSRRPGRKFEKDLVHLKKGRRVEGFVKGLEEGKVLVDAGGSQEAHPLADVIFLKMGEPSVVALGFNFRLKKFDIERHEETVENVLVMRAPNGEVVQTEPEPGREIDLGRGYRAKILKYLPDAIVDGASGLVPRSDEAHNPAVEVEITGNGVDEKRIAFAKFPSFHGKGGQSAVLVKLMQTEGMPKAYISEVSVEEEGTSVEEAVIEVNAPFTYGGYTFYQSSYREGPRVRTSVFQVVRDPGVGLAYAGFALILLGCLHIFFVMPVQRSRKRLATSEGEWARKGAA
ncbi:MAG: cytochrome c biogenesis protein ResB [Planctomycetota bacterium]